jgi:hypothetical protein
MLPLILLGAAYLISRTTKSVEEYHLGGDMSKHLAPNGKPSNLTHEQWHLVRTPEFKAWFGDWENNPENASKVVDENGEPKVVYRGSKSKNPNYIPHKHELSKGIYFSTKKEVAELYTTSVWQNWVGRVFDCFLNIRNIDVYDTFKLKSNIYQAEFKYYNDLVIESKKNNFNGIRWDNFIDVPDLRTIYPNEPIDYLATTFIVFEPNQIKLADGSNTTFDGRNPDIRYKRGGLVYKKTYSKGGGGYTTSINGVEVSITRNYGDKTWIAQSWNGEVDKEYESLKDIKNYLESLDEDFKVKYEDGGIFDDKELLKKYKEGKSIGFTAIAHLKAKGLIPRADGTKKKSDKYK